MLNSPFTFVGNDAALDFLNTVIIVNGDVVDLLERPADFVSWLKLAGFTVNRKDVSPNDFKKAIKLRETIRTLVNNWGVNNRAVLAAKDFINELLDAQRQTPKLIFTNGGYSFESPKAKLSSEEILLAIAKQAAELLVDTPSKRIRKCANDSCVIMFKDTSKSQRRRWCSMDVCGNRAKVAAHYKKSRE